MIQWHRVLLIVSAILLAGCDFNFVGSPALSNGRVAFLGAAVDFAPEICPPLPYPLCFQVPLWQLSGIYLHDSSRLRALAEAFVIPGLFFRSTPVPGGGTFLILGDPALDEHASVAFTANLLDGRNGLYLFTAGRLVKVVDSRDDIPGGAGHFSSFSNPPSMSDGRVVFFASAQYENTSWPAGIYSYKAGRLSTVADRYTLIPGHAETFVSFGRSVKIHGNRIVFVGGTSDYTGVFLFDGQSLSVVADTDTPIPEADGSVTFETFDSIAVSSELVAFVGSRGNTPLSAGVYITDGSGLTRVVDRSMTQPNGAPYFDFASLAVDGSAVLFSAVKPNVSRADAETVIYRANKGVIETVVDNTETLPVVGQPRAFYGVSASAGTIAFGVNRSSTYNSYTPDGSGEAILTTTGQKFALIAGPQTPVPLILLRRVLGDLHQEGIISEQEYQKALKGSRDGLKRRP